MFKTTWLFSYLACHDEIWREKEMTRQIIRDLFHIPVKTPALFLPAEYELLADITDVKGGYPHVRPGGIEEVPVIIHPDLSNPGKVLFTSSCERK